MLFGSDDPAIDPIQRATAREPNRRFQLDPEDIDDVRHADRSGNHKRVNLGYPIISY